MIEYKTKNLSSELKINGNDYKIDIVQVHADNGPKISINVSSETGAFNLCVASLDVFEVHTALSEAVNALATITHVHYSPGPTPMGYPAVAAPSAVQCAPAPPVVI